MSRARQVANFDPALLAADEVSGDKVSGGTIGAGVIGASVTGGAGLGVVGMIAPFAMASAPTGWIICNGAAVSRTVTYDVLFGIIGTTWGVGDGSGTFNLPDLEGAFLRGTGNHSETMSNGSVFAGPSVGAFEDDQFQMHWFGDNTALNTTTSAHYTGGDGANAALRLKDGAKRNNATAHVADNNHGSVDMQYNVDSAGSPYPLVPITDGTNGTPRVGDESRPFNAGVNYCIKF